VCHHYRTREARKAGLKPEWDNEFSLRSNLCQLVLPDEGFYPLAHVPAVRLDNAGARELVPAEWGFLPSWWKPSDKTPKRATFQRKTINARSEDVDDKPTYRDSFRRRRCLMPATEFFERGHYFHLEQQRLFAFAALWDRWRGGDGEIIDTCTLLTTSPNEAVQAVGHNRMPVVLVGEEQYARWLNPEIDDRAAVEDLLRPTHSDLWRRYPAESTPRDAAATTAGAARAKSTRDHSSQGLLFD
jgi:putative SOS response-associated peptidase YedK